MSIRTHAPEIHELESISFVKPSILPLNDYAHVFWMKEVADETARFEFHFDAGTIRGEKKVAGFVNSLLFSGTKDKESTQIHEELDALGAFIDQEIAQELAIISLYCLRSNAEAALRIFLDAIEHVSFDESEVSDLLRERKQEFLISSEKVSVLARRTFQKQLFAENPRYSRQLELEDFDRISVKDLKEFHQNYYLQGLNKVVIVANLEENFVLNLRNSVGKWAIQKAQEFDSKIIHKAGYVHVEKENAVQCAIRLGIPLFNKTNPDFVGFSVLQTVFGDYFGSRLMSNIREDKGYTYGISSGVSESFGSGYFLIATEVGHEFLDKTLTEIRFEMDRLRTELIPAEELNMVKNYLLGQITKNADGPNAMLDLFLTAYMHNKGFEYFNDAIQEIKDISSEKLMELANRYLNWDNFSIVSAGNSNVSK